MNLLSIIQFSLTIIFTGFLVLASIALAIITALYMIETRKMRIISYEALKIGSSPQVFISGITPIYSLDKRNSKLKILSIITITNTGKSEGRNLRISSELIFDNKLAQVKNSDPAPYIFPQQSIAFDSDFAELGLDQRLMESAHAQLLTPAY